MSEPPARQPDHLTGPSFGTMLVRAVRRHGDAPALQFAGRRLNYAELGQEVSRFIQALRIAGVSRGAGLAMILPNRIEALTVRLAAALIGARFTALNPLGSPSDHAFIVTDCEAEALITQPGFEASVEAVLSGPQCPKLLSVGAMNGAIDLVASAQSLAPLPLECEADPYGIVGITYTGGTTGRPKGIIHTHRVLMANLLMCLAEWDWPTRPSILLTTPLSHAAGLLVMPVFVKGGVVHLQAGFDPASFLEAVERERISVTFLVPTMLHAIVNHPDVRSRDLSSLKLIIYGASPISPALLTEAIGIFGPIFLQLYAQSEAPMTVTTLSIADHDPARPERLLSCGFPMVGVEVKLLDDDGREAAPGEVGEVCVRGPLVMDGYWRRPEESATALAGGWLHTGDLARADDEGCLYLVDRKKDLIISGGLNVYPKEVEDALSTHPAVAQAAVFGVPDPRWGEAVKASVVPSPGATPSESELIAHVRAAKGPVLAPKSIDFIDAMPVTPLGKPDKVRLRAPYWAGSDRRIG